MDEFLDIEKAKSFKGKEEVVVKNLINDTDGEYWGPPVNCVVLGTSQHSCFVRELNKQRTQRNYRWNDYGTLWGIISAIEYKEPVKNTKNKEVSNPVNVNTNDQTTSKTDETIAASVLNNTVEKEDVAQSVTENQNNDENLDKSSNSLTEATSSKRKSTDAQAKAVKKYTDKFDRINVRFEKGVMKKLKQATQKSGLSANIYIQNAVLNCINSDTTPNNIIPIAQAKGISKNIYEKIKEDILNKQAFSSNILNTEDIIKIIEKYVI